jgi:DNA-binding NtrC family response regulator
MSSDPKRPARPALVVLAEDEHLVRANALEALRDAGFEVLEATHADEAVAAIEADAAAVGALFTDVQMPGGSMDGMQLAEHTRANWPWIAVVIASGHAGFGGATVPHGCRFVIKPDRLKEVVQHVRDLTTLRH